MFMCQRLFYDRILTMKKQSFYGVKTSKGVKLDDKNAFYLYLDFFKEKDIVEITCKKIDINKKMRSNPQNRYYWQLLNKISSELGYEEYESDILHNAFKHLFLSDNSNKLPIVRSTSSLSTSEFEQYMSNIRRFMSKEYNMYLSAPNEENMIQ